MRLQTARTAYKGAGASESSAVIEKTKWDCFKEGIPENEGEA